MQQISSVT